MYAKRKTIMHDQGYQTREKNRIKLETNLDLVRQALTRSLKKAHQQAQDLDDLRMDLVATKVDNQKLRNRIEALESLQF